MAATTQFRSFDAPAPFPASRRSFISTAGQFWGLWVQPVNGSIWVETSRAGFGKLKGDSCPAIALSRGAPRTIRVDNGPEFISKALDRWAYENGVTLDFSRPGNPTDNAFVESFNDRLQDEGLNTHWFLSLEDTRAKVEAWWRDYNEKRPHTSLGWRTPIEYAVAAAKIAAE